MSGEAKFSLTTKISGDLFTIRGDNADEFFLNLDAVQNGDGIEVITKFLAQFPTQTNAGSNVKRTFGNEAKVESTSEAGAPTCDCGDEMVWKNGTAASGKAWKGYFCANGRKTCKPVWK